MPPNEVLPVESMEFKVSARERSPCLPPIAAPIPGEALPAWLYRFSKPMGLSAATFLFEEQADVELLSDGRSWRTPRAGFLERLAARTGTPLSVLKSMTFSDWTESPDADEVAWRFARGRVHKVQRKLRPSRRYGICPRCLASDAVPYVRKLWTLGWVAICEEHALVLNTACFECRAMFIMPQIRSTLPRWLTSDHCRCGASMIKQRARAAHPFASRLQSVLIAGRGEQRFEWAGLGTLTWSTAVALIDLILGLAWIGSRADLRRRCFEQIEYELGATHRLGNACHDGLLIAAWVLERWPDRAHWLSGELKVPSPRQQLVLWEHLPTDVHEALQTLLTRSDR